MFRRQNRSTGTCSTDKCKYRNMLHRQIQVQEHASQTNESITTCSADKYKYRNMLHRQMREQEHALQTNAIIRKCSTDKYKYMSILHRQIQVFRNMLHVEPSVPTPCRTPAINCILPIRLIEGCVQDVSCLHPGSCQGKPILGVHFLGLQSQGYCIFTKL